MSSKNEHSRLYSVNHVSRFALLTGIRLGLLPIFRRNLSSSLGTSLSSKTFKLQMQPKRFKKALKIHGLSETSLECLQMPTEGTEHADWGRSGALRLKSQCAPARRPDQEAGSKGTRRPV